LRPGDIILGVNKQPIDTSTGLPGLVANIKPGSEASFQVWRNGDQKNIDVRVAELKDEEEGPALAGRPSGTSGHQEPRLGLAVRPLSPQEQQEAQTEGGVLIEQAQGPAAAAGLQPGDIILSVGDKPVHTVADLRKATRDAKNSVALLVQREDARIYVPVHIG
jgi:serine protease Do